ncbi:MAG TPA: carbohydrate ABC transporter permease, partial [Spirochaetia bacterium]|nr:carbohydrate ABC transporter permease [Spirochaetia bacterium]
PRVFTLRNYEVVFENPLLLRSFFITVARTVVGSLTHVLFTAVVAYGLAKKDLMFRRGYMIFGIITLYFGGGLIPFYFVLKYLGLINRFAVFIVPGLYSVFDALLFIAYFRGIPDSLGESARIDGANEVFILARIILPISMPIVATIALFAGVGHWNAWFDSAFFTTNENLRTLQLVLWQVINQAANQEFLKQRMIVKQADFTIEAVRYATMMVAVGPIIFVYPFLQRYFIKGMLVGAIKG